MAGNIVKWWKHKILGGYKQFSVQECTTDSEELMYHQVRASSSCSAPPDLLLVSDRENNIALRSPVVNIITTPTNGGAGNGHKQQQQLQQQHHAQQQQSQQQQQHQQHGTKDPTSKHIKISTKNSNRIVSNTQISALMPQPPMQQHHHQQQMPQQFHPQPSQPIQHQQQTQSTPQPQQDEADGGQHHQQHQRHSTQQHGKEEHIRLEEFTCDVSVEGGKSTQPLQFSFTFYDLDGHHGKITKDDIVGIVYTIYESIGKSVVVPHCGSKTINVRLTVSPEGKSKAAANGKLKKIVPNAGSGGGTTVGMLEHSKHGVATTSGGHGSGHARRQHRYRPRKLIKSDDEDDDSNSEKEKEALTAAGAAKSKNHPGKFNKTKADHQQQPQFCLRQPPLQQPENLEQTTMDMSTAANNCQTDNLYENMTANLNKCYAASKEAAILKKCEMHVGGLAEDRRSCTVSVAAATSAGQHVRLMPTSADMYMKQASSRVKMLRKARKQKYQDHCLETRQRSLSVGNETSWRNRHLVQQQQQQHQQTQNPQPLVKEAPLGDVLDGVQLRNPQRYVGNASMPQKRNSAECWKTALNRNDLISIIRESMEKNRLCFQLNGKPQANVSPIRQPQHHQQQSQLQSSQAQHRQRSNTTSKIPTLIANHNNSITNNHSPISISSNNNSNCNSTNHHNNNSRNNNISNNNHIELSIHDNSSSSLYHPQPHIPIYHQQMAINPAVLAAQNGLASHSKMNLCGYDSFLHATICGGGTSHSPPPPPLPQHQMNTTISNQPTNHHHHQLQQPIATVQPIMTIVNTHTAGPNLQPKIFANSTTHQIKMGKILRSGSYSQAHASASQNSPQYHGYQRLSSSAVLQQATKGEADGLDKWLHGRAKCQKSTKRHTKPHDNQLYAKLSEKLEESTLNAGNCNKENMQRRKHKIHKRIQPVATSSACIQRLPTHETSSSLGSTESGEPKPVQKSSSDYIRLEHINSDPIECENLLGQTTDDETSNELITPTSVDLVDLNEDLLESKECPNGHVATATLVDLNDDDSGARDQMAPDADAELEEDDDEDVEDEREETESGGSVSPAGNVAEMATTPNSGASAPSNTSTSSSLIHRYVHEHIHHHYHHFEEKEVLDN